MKFDLVFILAGGRSCSTRGPAEPCQPGNAVTGLPVTYVAIALVTCNVLVRLAPVRPLADEASAEAVSKVLTWHCRIKGFYVARR
jgi:hypothetical protein